MPFSNEMMGDAEYLAAWRVVIDPILTEYAPDIILGIVPLFDAFLVHPICPGKAATVTIGYGRFAGKVSILKTARHILQCPPDSTE